MKTTLPIFRVVTFCLLGLLLLTAPRLGWGQRAGDLDTSFHTGTGVYGNIVATKILPNGKILIAGSFTNYQGVSRNGIARLNADDRYCPHFIGDSGKPVSSIS